jgi:outer membrane cobalamin receptor
MLVAALMGCAAQARAQAPPPLGLQQIEIIGTSPLPGQGVSRDVLPYNTQVVRRGALDAAHADNASDFMARRLPGVQVNDIQGSPLQGDLTFRGFRASGLLGASQGLSVYMDGVRVNEPFGDVVNWDLVPEFAIDSMSLVPGANPAFGLNSLGGALSFTTASGRSAPGVRGEASLGSFGRKRLSLSHGAQHDNGLHHYVGIGLFDERGWRDFSDGRVGTVVAKLGHSGDAGDFSLNLLAGRSTLVGNGLTPLFTFDDAGTRSPDIGQARRAAVYTHPDETKNRVTQASLQWRRTIGEQATLEALVYARNSRRQTINGDEAEQDEEGEEVLEGSVRRQAFAPPGSPVNAAFNRTATRQRALGAALAWSQTSGAHQWQVGASVDAARVRYAQTEREGTFDATRGVLPFEDEPDELSARVAGRTRSLGVYATDTWRVAPRTHVTATLRMNHARVANTLATVDDDTDIFEQKPKETFSYRSANPALGVAHRLGDGAPTLFANIARNNRVPTVIELGCADPEEPCRLPAGLQADPFLEQVVSRTLEGGLRFGSNDSPWRGALTLFRTDNRNDILFRSVSVAGQLGYFQNFPRTRHQGLDAEATTRWGQLELGLAYSHLQATYEAAGTLRAGERNVQVTPGTRIAGLPRHLFKASLDWRAGGGVALGADVQVLSRRGVAGNEDGRIENGAEERVDFSLPGYALLNLRAAWKPESVKGLELFARVTNVTNRRYASFGAIAETVFDANGAYSGDEADALFVAPGAPRAFTVGARWHF